MVIKLLLTLFFCCTSALYAAEQNKIIVCDNGLEMFHWDLAFLKEATQSVEVIPCFFGGELARTLLKALEARIEEVPELQVYLLASPTLLEPEDWSLVYHLEEKFPDNFHMEFAVQVAKLIPDLMTIDNHVKMFVVDEKYFSTGGTNLNDKFCGEGTFNPKEGEEDTNETEALFPKAMRDQDVVGSGPLAKELRHCFYTLYSLWEHYNKTQLLREDPEDFTHNPHYLPVFATPFVEKFDHSERVRILEEGQIKIVLGGPHQRKNAITEEYIRLIQGAKEEIILEHLYFLPIDSVLQALMDAVNRGVKLTLVTNALSDFGTDGTHLFCWGNRMSYVPIFYGSTYHFWDFWWVATLPVKNTEIFEYHIERVWLHKKVMLVDGKTAVIGSYNLGIKSAYGDYELILVIDSEEVVHDVRKVFEKDLTYSRKITPEQACSWYFNPWISYFGELQKRFSGIL